MIQDALGNEIVIGECYGYTINQNGFTTVTVGVANNVTEKGQVTLNRFYKGRQLYNNQIDDIDREIRKVSVKPINLFPVNRSSFNR